MYWLFKMRLRPVFRLASLALLFVWVSCSGDDDGQNIVIDCAEEAALVQIEDDNDLGGMTVEFTVQYTGDLEVRSASWDFGDGTKDTGVSVSHLYTDAGTYRVQALVNLTYGAAECTAEPETTITIQ